MKLKKYSSIWKMKCLTKYVQDLGTEKLWNTVERTWDPNRETLSFSWIRKLILLYSNLYVCFLNTTTIYLPLYTSYHLLLLFLLPGIPPNTHMACSQAFLRSLLLGLSVWNPPISLQNSSLSCGVHTTTNIKIN